MRHKVATFKIGRSSAHRRALLANMAASVFDNGRIETTLVKAKELRRFVEKLITSAKNKDLHHRRLVVAKLRNKTMAKKLFDEIAPSYLERKGGYTSIVKLGQRRGDAAEMCILMLVDAAKAEKPAEAATEEVAKN